MILLSLLSLFGLLLMTNSASDEEILALYQLYTSTGGDKWSWTTNALAPLTISGDPWEFSTPLNESDPCNHWQGVNCSDGGGIAGLTLQFLQMKGRVPSSLCNLTALEVLSFGNNALSGSIPSCISSLGRLWMLDMKANVITGEIPETLWEMTTLRIVAFLTNRLTGTLSRSVGNLSDVYLLDLADNLMSGPLPSELGLLTTIEYLPIGHNHFSGTIPREIGNMSALLYLGILRCFLTGPVPDTVSSMVQLQSLTLSNNFLTGPFPQGVCNMASLANLQLYNNNLGGPIPSLANMTGLRVLQLQENRFSGRLSVAFGESMMKSLINTIDVSANQFTGSIPSFIFGLPFLINLAMSSNCFTGTVPSTICDAERLRVLSMVGLSSNSDCNDHRSPFLDMLLGDFVHGNIPSCLWELPNITAIYLAGNRFSGSIADVSTDSNLFELSLSYNHFTGSLPLSVQQLAYSLLDVSHNTFRGNIAAIANANAKSNYSNNEIKTELNRFSGHLPSSFSHMQSTELDILRGNMFACDNIPPSDEGSTGGDNYSCGSRNLDQALYVACGGVALWVLLFGILALEFFAPHTLPAVFAEWLRYVMFIDSIPAAVPSAPKFLKFNWMLNQAVRVILIASIAGVALCIPVFVLKLSHDYVTYDHTYSWLISLAYTSGMVASLLVLLAWATLVAVGIWCLYFQRHREPVLQLPSGSSGHEKISGKHRKVRLSLLSVTVSTKWKYYGALILLFNALVVLGANALYVYLYFLDLSNSTTQAIQILFALFTLFWNYIVMARYTLNPSETFSRRVLLKTYIEIFSSVVAPTMVLFLTDSNCFRDLMVEPDGISPSYQYPQCLVFLEDGGCALFVPIPVILDTIKPPFIYNNGCSSTLISAYIPVYLYYYTFLMVVVPIIYCLLSFCLKYRNIPSFIQKSLPGVLWPEEWRSQPMRDRDTNSTLRETSNLSPFHESECTTTTASTNALQVEYEKVPLFFRAESIFAQLAHHLCILLTFGLTSPPLVVCIVFTCIATLVTWKAFLGRFLLLKFEEIAEALGLNSKANRNREQITSFVSYDRVLQLIELSLENIESGFDSVCYPILFCSTLFVSFICYDITASDSSSPNGASWGIPLAALCTPLLLRFSWLVYSKKKKIADAHENLWPSRSISSI